MSHALLLRLAESPHWSLHTALHYLSLYSDHIGISHYITRRLGEVSGEELRNVWGFICHLLVTRPSPSAALECFIIEQAQSSTHLALMTLWFMQGHLKDLATANHENFSFVICERVISKIHEVIYDESIQDPSTSNSSNHKLIPHANASFVGIGTVAAAIGLPSLGPVLGDTVMKQARLATERRRGSGYSQNPLSEGSLEETEEQMDDRSVHDSPTESDKEGASDDVTAPAEENSKLVKSLDRAGLLANSYLGTLKRQHIAAAQTNPSLPLSSANSRNGSKSLDFRIDPESRKSPHMSSPSLPLSKQTSPRLDNNLLDYATQSSLLRKHYLQTEVNFLLTLEGISNRLVLIPKPARVSALRAQLTALNHRLPLECCIPLWCQSTDKLRSGLNVPEPHHRIVRIPAGECVALNSAERAPFLLLIEYLENDLNFLPAKRANREIISKMLTGKSRTPETNDKIDQMDLSIANPTKLAPTVECSPIPLGPQVAFSPEEEVDIVEQIYGPTRLSIIDDGKVFEDAAPLTPRNIVLDNVAWTSKAGDHSSPWHASQRKGPLVAGSASAPYPQRSNLSTLTLEQYADRMNAAAAMLAQLNAALLSETKGASTRSSSSRWLFGSGFVGKAEGNNRSASPDPQIGQQSASTSVLPIAEAERIKDKIMQEMDALEEERMRRMRIGETDFSTHLASPGGGSGPRSHDDDKIRKELRKEDPSAAVFSESWEVKKSRIRAASPYGHLANWSCASVIIKTGADLRQEQLAIHLIKEFSRIWREENCQCFVRPFHVLITGPSSGLVETIVDAVSVHSIKKAMYARKLSIDGIMQATLLEHFIATYGEPHSAKFQRAQRYFALSLAGYSLVTYLLQVKDRHNGNILLHRDGHIIHIDFGFMLSNSPGNLGFEAAPFKLPMEYIELLGGIEGTSFRQFQEAFREGFLAARKHSHRIITLVELMQKDSTLPCFTALGDQTAVQLRNRFQPQNVSDITSHIDTLIISSLGSAWTRLYDSFQYYTQNIF